jgi:hypothetical protein
MGTVVPSFISMNHSILGTLATQLRTVQKTNCVLNYVQLANKIITRLQNNKNTIIKLIKDYINLVEKWITSLLTSNPGDIHIQMYSITTYLWSSETDTVINQEMYLTRQSLYMKREVTTSVNNLSCIFIPYSNINVIGVNFHTLSRRKILLLSY